MERFTVLVGNSDEVKLVLRNFDRRVYYATEFSHLYRWNSELLLRSLALMNKDDQDLSMRRHVTEAMLEKFRFMEPVEMLRDPGNVDSLKLLLDICDRNGIEAELLFAPYLPTYVERVPEVGEWIAWLETQIGRPVKDYSQRFNLNPSADDWFADRVHLNTEGSAEFARIIIADGVLP